MVTQINFGSDEESFEKLRVLSFKTKKDKKVLLQEGLDNLFKKYEEQLNE